MYLFKVEVPSHHVAIALLNDGNKTKNYIEVYIRIIYVENKNRCFVNWRGEVLYILSFL